MQLTKNFSKEEFDCHCGCEMPSLVLSNVSLLASQLEILRDCFGTPIHVNSGYRCIDHNKSIGGAAKSQHLLGKAADIVVENYEPEYVADNTEYLIEVGELSIMGLGRYNTFTHVDIRDSKTLIKWEI